MWRLTSASVRPDSPSAVIGEHGPVRRDGRSPQSLDLVGVLDRAQLAHRRTGRHQLGGIERRTEAQREACPHLVLDRDPTGRPDQRLHRADRVIGLVPGDDLDVVGQVTEGMARQRLLESREHQDRDALDREHQAREPLERRGGVPEQIGVVGRGGDQQHVDRALGGGLGRPTKARAVRRRGEQARRRRSGGHEPSLHRWVIDPIRRVANMEGRVACDNVIRANLWESLRWRRGEHRPARTWRQPSSCCCWLGSCPFRPRSPRTRSPTPARS